MNHDSSRPRLHRGGATAALACVAALAALTACSSSSSSSTPSSPSSSASTPAPASSATGTAPSPSPTAVGAPACANGTLQVKLGESEGYAGGVDVPIDFTNTSGASCTLFGYPGVSLLSSTHAQIGLAAKRGTTVPPVKVITLAPGATATAQLQIADALNFPTATCGPVQATDLRVYPPNQTVPVLLPEQSKGCTKPVQVLLIGAVQSGSA